MADVGELDLAAAWAELRAAAREVIAQRDQLLRDRDDYRAYLEAQLIFIDGALRDGDEVTGMQALRRNIAKKLENTKR